MSLLPVLYTSYISAGINGFWCLPMTISHPAGPPGGMCCPPMTIFPLVNQPGGILPKSMPHFMGQSCGFWCTYDNISLCWPAWWYLLPPMTIFHLVGQLDGNWCPPKSISHFVGRTGGFWCPPMTIPHPVDHPVVSRAHL